MSIRKLAISIFTMGILSASSPSIGGEVQKHKPFGQINWSDIHDSLDFDRKFAPSDGFGFTRVVYIAKLPDGSLSQSTGIILYLSANHDGKRSPECSIIAAYEYSGSDVQLINHFRFKYTADTILEWQWVFVRKDISHTGIALR